MAKIIDLGTYNSVRGNDVLTISDTAHISNSFGSVSNTFKFENKDGDKIVITPLELKEHISDFIINEFDFYADENINQYREQLKRRLDVQMSKIEEHLNDKLNKITEQIVSTTTSRLINEEVNRRVDEKLRKIRKAIDESI
jgi:hypothetical protein